MSINMSKLLSTSGGQTISDYVTSMKHSISGSMIAKSICKATTNEIIAPKRKHLIVLVTCTYEPRLCMPDFANYIIGRAQNNYWVVSFKGLITLHHLMNHGNEKFSQYLAVNSIGLTAIRPSSKNAIASRMAPFIRNYSKYLDAKAVSYRSVGFDLCRSKRNENFREYLDERVQGPLADEFNLRLMPQDKLFKTIPAIESQIDALLAFDASPDEIINDVILSAYLILYKDLIRLYAAYNESMINLIERYFNMQKKDCQEALRFYKSFVKRLEYVNTFVKVAEGCERMRVQDGFPKSSLIFKPVPNSVLDALEQHLGYLEGRRATDGARASISSSLNSSMPSNDVLGGHFTSLAQQHIIEEERLRLEDFVSKAEAHKPSRLSGLGLSDEADLLGLDNIMDAPSSDDFFDLFTSPSTNGLALSQTGPSSLPQPSMDPFFQKNWTDFDTPTVGIASSQSNYSLQQGPNNSFFKPAQFVSPPQITNSELLPSDLFTVQVSNTSGVNRIKPISSDLLSLNPQPANLDTRLTQLVDSLSITSPVAPQITTVDWSGQRLFQPNPTSFSRPPPGSSLSALSSSNPWSSTVSESAFPQGNGQFAPFNPSMQQPMRSTNPFL